MRLGWSLVLAAVLLVPVRAFATADGAAAGAAVAAPAPLDPPAPGRWYGWELMVSDAVFLLMANDGRISNPELGLGNHQFALGLGGLVLGAPALHLIHGNRRRAAIGLGVRAVIIGLYAAADASLRTGGNASGGGDNGGGAFDSGDVVMGALLFGTIVGGLAFAFVDDVWHARVTTDAPTSPQAMLAPTFFLNRRSGGLGLMATF